MAQKIFVAVDNSSLFDIALNTYGSLDFIGKLIEDNPGNGLNLYPTAGTQFVWDDSLQISQTNAIIGGSGIFVGQKFATRPTNDPQADYAPENILPPTISGATSIGSTLFAISGAWAGLPTPTLSFQWQSSTDGGITWSDIVGQIASTYVLVPGDELKEIRVNQIALNSLGTAERASAYVQPYSSGGGSSIPPSVSVAPTSFVAGGGAPTIGKYLVLSPGAWNGDGAITFTYEWTIGATVVGIAQVYQIQSADFGQSIVGKVIATNAFGTANASTAGITAVQIPINTVAPVVSGTDIVGSVLTTTNGTWTGNAPITFTYQWLRNGAVISGAINSTYTQVLADMGQVITCRVNGSNLYGNADAVGNSITTRYAPVNVDAPIVYGTPTVGSVLSAFVGNWTEFPSSTKAHQWQLSTDGGSTWSNIGTGTTYTVVSGDVGNLIRVSITATNSAGNSTADSPNFSIPSAGTQRPENTIAPAITGTPAVGNVLTCSTGTWNGSPSGYDYQWYRDTTPVGTNSNTYTQVTGDTNALIKCVVSATNVGGTEPATSNEVFCYDADFYAVVTFATSQGYTLPTTAQQQHFSRIVTSLKGIGYWTIHDRFFVFANNGSSNFGRINWMNPTLGTMASTVNSPAWTSNAGFVSNGTNAHIDTNFNPSIGTNQYTLDNAGRYMFLIRPNTNPSFVDGTSSASSENTLVLNAGAAQPRINQGTSGGAGINSHAGGFHCVTRTGASVSNYANDVIFNLNIASTAIFNSTQRVLRGAASNAVNGTVASFYAMGGGVPTADIPSYRSIINRLIANL
ncbi:MAG: hypothetical protein ACR2IL_02315 [Chitinophagaceae bacterium]